MAVDRGGLQYTISVRDQFSRATSRFRQEIGQSKAALREFQRELSARGRGARAFAETNKLSREQLSLLKRLQAESRRQAMLEREAVRIRNTQTRDRARQLAAETQARKAAAREAERALVAEQRRLQAVARAQQQRERIAKRIADQQRRDRAAQARRDPRLVAQERLNRELFQESVLRERIALLQARGRTQIAAGDIVGGARTLRRARELRQNIEGTRNAASQLLFTFRRLVGVLAIFTLARRGVQTFNQLVAVGVRFNNTVENATLGIGGLIATLADVRDEFGQSVGQAEELDLALGEARRQVFLLRQDSLRTVATFEQLLDTFQVAVGPGLAAGLNLDEIRSLTVRISQAAAALSVPQNQLAEEIRSLLAGTIQARTTRIATALGITNADIRRLRETGELADFLEERLQGFADAAERAARQTLSGIQALVQGALGETLGQAAQPLFDELIEAGNELLDEVLTIRDEAGNIRPNPEAVAAFQQIFDALRQGLERIRELGADLGFSGLQNLIGAFSTGLVTAIEFAIGAARTLFATFQLFARPIRALADAFDITNQQLGGLAAIAGEVTLALLIANKALSLFGANLGTVIQGAIRLGGALGRIGPSLLAAVGPVAILVAGIVAVGKGIEFILEKIFDVDLSLKETIQLVGLGLFAAFDKVGALVARVALQIQTFFANAIDTISTSAQNQFLAARRLFASSDAESQRLVTEQINNQAQLARRVSMRRMRLEGNLARIREEHAREQLAIEEEIANIIGEAAARGAQGPGFDPDFDAAQAAADALKAASDAAAEFNGNLSTVDKSIAALEPELLKVSDAIRNARFEFQVGVSPAEGLGGQLDEIFREEDIDNSERLFQINNDLENTLKNIADIQARGQISAERRAEIEEALSANVEDRAAALEALDLTAEEGTLVSLLRDQLDLRDAILSAELLSAQLAGQKAAVLAQRELPALREETALRNAEATALRALVAAEVANASERQLALVTAQNELDVFRNQATIQRAKMNAEITIARARVESAEVGSKEAEILQAALEALIMRREIEEDILDLTEMRLEKQREEAGLRVEGSFADGVSKGLEQLRDELPTIFEVGLNLTRQVVTSFARFAATEIVNAIVNAQQEGVDESELFRQAAGRFVQELATQILEQVIQNLILQLLGGAVREAAIETTSATTAAGIRVTGAQLAGDIEIAAATTAAGIRAATGGIAGGHEGGFVMGFNQGGFVRGMAAHFTQAARGFLHGGFARPAHLHPADTIPAWLSAGEFVMRRRAVEAIGLDTLTAMNNGNFGVVGSAGAEAAGPAVGMQAGGLVGGRQSAPDDPARRASREDPGDMPAVGVLVAREREADLIAHGGRNAMLNFIRENAATIGAYIDRGRSR